jgi:multiple sugar transport system substrate-binding protein
VQANVQVPARLFCFFLLLLLVACAGKAGDRSPAPAAPTAEGGVNSIAAGSQTQADAAPAGPEPVTIRFAVREWDEARYKPLITLFEEDNPDIQVELVWLDEWLRAQAGERPEDAYLRLAAAADVWATTPGRESVSVGLVLDLAPLMASHNLDTDDFYPGVLEQAQWDGGTWFLPTEIDYFFIYFNKRAFDQAGLAYPEPGWSSADFLSAARALTLWDGATTTQWGFIEPYPDGLAFVHAHAGPLFDGRSTPPTARLNSPEVVQAVAWFADLFLVHQVAPHEFSVVEMHGRTAVELPDGWEQIRQGQAAMWKDAGRAWPDWSRQMDVGIVPFPVGDHDRPTTHALSNGYAISAGTSHARESWRWLLFLSQQLPAQSSSPVLPARRSVAATHDFWNSVGPDVAAALRYAVDHSYWWSTYILLLEGSRLYPAFSEALTAILTGTRTVADALHDAQAEAQLSLEQAWLHREEVTAVPPPSVARPVDEAGSQLDLTVDFVVPGDPDRLQIVRDLARQFEALNPGVRVTVSRPDFSRGSLTPAQLAANADCFEWGTVNLHAPDARATILNLEPFIDADPTIAREDFFSAVLNVFTYEGQLYALPADVSIPLIAYNKALFDATGVPYPDANWSTDDFFSAAVALTRGEGDSKQYGFVPDVFESGDMLNLIQQRGARLFDGTVTPAAATFDDPTVSAAMSWFVALSESEVKPVFITGSSAATPRTYAERHELIENGRAAMWTLTDYGGVAGPDVEGLDVGLVPLPLDRHQHRAGGFQSARGYFIAAGTEARPACWQWITFLSQQPAATLALPARRDVATSAAFRQQAGPERADTYLASLERPGQSPFVQHLAGEDGWLALSTRWLVLAYDAILKGEMPVAEALARAQSLAGIYRACVITDHAFADSIRQQACFNAQSWE